MNYKNFYCQECGKQIPEESKYCSYCGYKQSDLKAQLEKRANDFYLQFGRPMADMRGIKETAEHFHLKRPIIYQLVKSGKVKYVRVGKKFLVNQQSVADYFNNGDNIDSEQVSGIKPIPVKL